MTATVAITGRAVAERLNAAIPGIVLESDDYSLTVPSDRIVDAAMWLRDDEELDCKFLNTLLGVDWLDHFDVVYVISSMAKNQSLTLKARSRHEDPVVPSVSKVWQGAFLQEREVFDLMGIAFSDHPDLKRIFLWEGFPGHPLRKDFLALPGGYKPGLQRFPYEFPTGQRQYTTLRDTDSPSAPEVPLIPAAQPLNAPPQPETRTGGGQLGLLGGGVHGSRSEEPELTPASASDAAKALSEPDQERTTIAPRSEADAGEVQTPPPSSGAEVAPPDQRIGPNTRGNEPPLPPEAGSGA
jgi:NADH-quinone oxidoreductase subunit C